VFLYQTKKKWSSVTGVFNKQEDAVAFWESMSPEMRQINEPIEIDANLHYPFYVVEFVDDVNRTNGFEYLTLDGVEAELRDIQQTPGDQIYFTVYEVLEDWKGNPKYPGGDYMGALKHWHVDNAFLQTHGTNWPK
jgi:hypothetical protein